MVSSTCNQFKCQLTWSLLHSAPVLPGLQAHCHTENNSRNNSRNDRSSLSQSDGEVLGPSCRMVRVRHRTASVFSDCLDGPDVTGRQCCGARQQVIAKSTAAASRPLSGSKILFVTLSPLNGSSILTFNPLPDKSRCHRDHL